VGNILQASNSEPTTITGLPLAADRTLKTFIVEDSPLILQKLIDTLEELAPVKVVGSAADESSAVSWLELEGRHCELIIIDVFLRSGTGLGVLRAAQRLSVPGKCVVLTNYATSDMREACRALGADRVFDKSSELEELLLYCDDLDRSIAGR
jgi:DNA-binding NarL/FixJ family response regulator